MPACFAQKAALVDIETVGFMTSRNSGLETLPCSQVGGALWRRIWDSRGANKSCAVSCCLEGSVRRGLPRVAIVVPFCCCLLGS